MTRLMVLCAVPLLAGCTVEVVGKAGIGVDSQGRLVRDQVGRGGSPESTAWSRGRHIARITVREAGAPRLPDLVQARQGKPWPGGPTRPAQLF